MKNGTIVFILIMISIVVTIVSCSKSDSSSTSSRPPSTPENETILLSTLSQNASDQTNIQNDEDFIESDVQKAVTVANNLYGTPVSIYDTKTLPNAVIDMSLLKTSKIIKIGYTSDTIINNISKSGTITIQLANGTKWSDQGAKIIETLDSVKITYNANSRVYQSTRVLVNLLGGTKNYLAQFASFVYTIHSYGTVSFTNNKVCSYWITRKNTLINTSNTNNFPTIFTSNGDSTINGDSFTMGGVSRFNTSFKVKDVQMYSASINCNFLKPYAGIRSFIAGDTVNITFGVNPNGFQTALGASTLCDSLYGYKIEWTKLNGTLGSKVFSY